MTVDQNKLTYIFYLVVQQVLFFFSVYLKKNTFPFIFVLTQFDSMRNYAHAKLTRTRMSQNRVQFTVVIIQAAGLVVAVGPFTLHQERPRHVWCLYFPLSVSSSLCTPRVRNPLLHFTHSPRCSDFITGQIETLLVDRRDGVGIFGRLLRMRREAVSFTRCRGTGGQKQDHLPLWGSQYGIEGKILYILLNSIETIGPLTARTCVVCGWLGLGSHFKL